MLSNLSYACFKVRANTTALASAIARETEKKLDLGSLVHSFANWGERQPALMEVLQRHASQNIGLYQPTDLTRLVWGVTKLGVDDEAFLNAAARAVSWKVNKFNPQQLSTI